MSDTQSNINISNAIGGKVSVAWLNPDGKCDSFEKSWFNFYVTSK